MTTINAIDFVLISMILCLSSIITFAMVGIYFKKEIFITIIGIIFSVNITSHTRHHGSRVEYLSVKTNCGIYSLPVSLNIKNYKEITIVTTTEEYEQGSLKIVKSIKEDFELKEVN